MMMSPDTKVSRSKIHQSIPFETAALYIFEILYELIVECYGVVFAIVLNAAIQDFIALRTSCKNLLCHICIELGQSSRELGYITLSESDMSILDNN